MVMSSAEVSGRSSMSGSGFPLVPGQDIAGGGCPKSNAGGASLAGRGKAMARALWYAGPGRAEIRQRDGAGAGAGPRCGCGRSMARSAAAPSGWSSLGACRESEYERMRAPFMAGDFPFPVEIRLHQGRPGRGGAPELTGGPSLRSIRTRPCSRFRPRPRCRFRRRCRRSARCLPPTWRPRSTRLWDARPGRPTASRWSAPACSVRWSPARRADTGNRCDAGRYRARARRSGARPSASASRCPTAAPDDCDLVVHASASARGSGDRAAACRRRRRPCWS